MADDQNQRPYRSNEPPARGAPAATPSSDSDPLAELARLIGQTDPFAEFGRDSARRAAAPPPAPEAPAAAPNFGANEYFGAATAPPAQPPEAQPYGAPSVARQPYANPTYAASADLYHAENEVPGYPAQAGGYEAAPYPQQHHAGEDEDHYDDVPPSRRRLGVMAIAAVFALAVIGTAGAFGYRALFGSSTPSQPPPVIKADTAPSKIVPASASKTPNKLITDRIVDRTQDEKLVSREEQPVEMKDKPAGGMLSPSQDSAQPSSAVPAALGSSAANEPKKIRTIAIRPDQAGMADSQPMAATATAPPPPPPAPVKQAAPVPPPRVVSNAPVADNPEPPPPRQTEARAVPPASRTTAPAPVPSNAPLSLSPNAPATPAARAPVRTATVAAPAQTAPARTAQPASSGSYAVQVSSQRSEADAQTAFRSLQAKYPTQLGGRQALIHKVELGEKGTYYRAMVGPFASASDASTLCSGLKAAGGQCIVQRN